jgi:chromosome segregation ATPase
MRGYKAEAREASLEGEKIALKGQIEILQQRLALAAEQQKVVTEQAKEFQAELAQLKAKVGKGESVGDLQLFTTTLGATLDKVVNSNNAVGSTLTLVLPDGPPVVIPARRDREGD